MGHGCVGFKEPRIYPGLAHQPVWLRPRLLCALLHIKREHALGEAVVRTWSHLPKDVQNSLFQEAVTSQGESIRPQLAVFLHAKHPRTLDPLGKPREMMEPDSLGG